MLSTMDESAALALDKRLALAGIPPQRETHVKMSELLIQNVRKGTSTPLSERSRDSKCQTPSVLDEVKADAKASIATLLNDLAQCWADIDPDRRDVLQSGGYNIDITQWESILRRLPDIIETTPWAEIGTPPLSKVGRGSRSIANADVIYRTPEEFEEYCRLEAKIDKPVVIVGDTPSESSGVVINAFLTRLRDRYPDSDLDVQNLSLRLGEPSTNGKARKRVTGLHDLHQAPGLSNQNPPTNVLNIRDIVEEHQPRFLQQRRFQILPTIHSRLETKQIASEVSATYQDAYPWIKAKQLGPRVPTPAGKQSLHFNLDLSACQKFNLFAERGSYTGWHVDILNGTYVHTLAGMKLWLIMPHITDEEREEFSEWGPLWTPAPGRAKMILLRQGDTLIMPPGMLVVHSVITLQDSLMTGGMFWDARSALDIVKNIAWIASKSTVTNEPIPRQLPATVDTLEELVLSDPERFIPSMFDDDDEDELAGPRPMTVEEMLPKFAAAKATLRAAITCPCTGPCIEMCKNRKCKGRETNCEHLCVCRRSVAQEGICTTWCHANEAVQIPCQDTALERALRDQERRKRTSSASASPSAKRGGKRRRGNAQ